MEIKEEKQKKLWEKALKQSGGNVDVARKIYKSYLREEMEKLKRRKLALKEKQKEKKRRTRALILLGIYLINKVVENDIYATGLLKKLIEKESERKNLVAKEGKSEIDYFVYIQKEIEKKKSEKMKKDGMKNGENKIPEQKKSVKKIVFGSSSIGKFSKIKIKK